MATRIFLKLITNNAACNDLAEKIAALTPQQYKVLGDVVRWLTEQTNRLRIECFRSHHQSTHDGDFPQARRKKPHTSRHHANGDERLGSLLVSEQALLAWQTDTYFGDLLVNDIGNDPLQALPLELVP